MRARITPSPFKRHEHHITRAFYQFLLSRVDTPFAYGTNDCAMFAGDAVLAITGVDILADFRGQYSDGVGALRAIEKITGGKSVSGAADWVAAKFGIVELRGPLFAQRGDLVLVEHSDASGDTEFLGVVAISGHEVAIPGARGLMHLPLMNATKGWKI